VLDLVNLRDRAKDRVSTLSNGMKQRLTVARALLHEPLVLFLDEPTQNLDPIAARDLRGVIEQLSQEGMTILMTTHVLEEADALCERVAFIVDGRIVADDTPRNLKIARSERTLVLTVSDPGDEDGLTEVELDMDRAADQDRLAKLMAQGRVRTIHSQEPTLEDVFVDVAGVRPA
jgi:ABC-2 type transport system ATP-binding protein